LTAVAGPSTTNTTELVRFLLARLDEDDAQLRRLRRDHSRDGQVDDASGVRSIERLRAECEAKRAVIGCAQQLLVLRDQPAEKPVRDAAVHLLCALAVPYRSHQAFRGEWESRRHR
jgi:hypothetical protein